MLPLAELLPLLARPVIDAIANRPAQSETERAAWVDSATRRIVAFEPRDGMEVMLACQAVVMQFLMLDAVRDAAHAATPEQARRRRGQAATLGGAHITILKEIRTHRAAAARVSKAADPVAPTIHAPAAQPPEIQPLSPQPPSPQPLSPQPLSPQSPSAQPLSPQSPTSQTATPQPDASTPRPRPQMTPAAVPAQSPAQSRPHAPIPPHPGRQQASPVVLPGLPVPGGRPGADLGLLASPPQAAHASR